MRCMALLVASLSVLSSCGLVGRARHRANAASKTLQCPKDEIKLTQSPRFWRAVGCGKEARCDTQHRDWVCDLVPVPEERAKRSAALRSGCSADRISTIEAMPSLGGYGSFRLDVCGAPWVCAVSEGTEDCSASAPAAAAPDPSAGCHTDSECKGDRICTNGVCADPARAEQ